MTTRMLLCSIGLLAALASMPTVAPFVAAPVAEALLVHVAPAQTADSPNRGGQWAKSDLPPSAALESDETDDCEELLGREKATEALPGRVPDASQQAMFSAGRQPILLTTLNALRVRLQI